MSVIYAGLSPLADLLVEREQWCRFTLGNKTGRRKLQGQSYSKVEIRPVLKWRAQSSLWLWCLFSPCLPLWPHFSLFFSISCRLIQRSCPASQGSISTSVCIFITCLPQCLLPTMWQLSFLVLAGCNSNSMWKLCMFHWKCCYLQRGIKHNTEAHHLWSARVSILLCQFAKIVHSDWWWTMTGHKVMTYELTASKFECLPVSSVGHCRVLPTAQTWTIRRTWVPQCTKAANWCSKLDVFFLWMTILC